MKSVMLDENQAKIVMQALDVAVRQGGLNASALLLPVAQEIEKQLVEEKDGNADAGV